MKPLADENIDRPIVDRLRSDGHSIFYVKEMHAGISDDTVLEMANQQDALLLTADKDFGEIVFRQGRIFKGVVLIRLAGLSSLHKSEIVSNALKLTSMN